MKTSELTGIKKTNDSKPKNLIQKWIRIPFINKILPLILQFIILVVVGLFYKVSAQTAVFAQGDNFPQQNKTIMVASFVNTDVKAEKLPSPINSTYREYKPLVSADGKTLYFGRQNHPGNVGGITDHEDIWFSKFDDKTGTWGPPERMGAPVNNPFPNFLCCVSMGGDSIAVGNVYLKNGEKMRAGISCSIREDSTWSFPMQIEIEQEYNLSDRVSYFLDRNGQLLISSVERDDTYGERDLYISFFKKGAQEGTGTIPINLGDAINTELDESSPFLASDYKSLYFASKGHNGYGGYDIFVSYRLDDTWQNWSTPVNLGPAINSELDEQYLNFTFNDQYAYFSKEVSADNVDLFRIPLMELFKAGNEINNTNNPLITDKKGQHQNKRFVNAQQTGEKPVEIDYSVISEEINIVVNGGF